MWFSSSGDGYDVEHGLKEDGIFEKWLQCYQNPNMKSLIDRNKRTIWFDGEPGPLVPKGENKLVFLNIWKFSPQKVLII